MDGLNNDVWIEIVSFLEPMDVLASLSALSRNLQELIKGFYSEQFNDWNYLNNNNIKLAKLKIGYSNHDPVGEIQQINADEGNNRINIMKKKLLIIRYYLVRVACLQVDGALDEYDMNLFNFYRNQLGNSKHNFQEDNTVKRIVKYLIIGNKQVGKSRFFRSFNCEHYSPYLLSNIGADFVYRKYEFLDFTLNHQMIHGSQLIRSNKIPNYFLSCSYLLLGFSIDNRDSWNNISNYWIPIWKQFDCHTTVILIGFYPREEIFERQVSEKEAIELATNQFNSIYIEINSSQMKNVFLPSWFIHLECMFSNTWKLVETRIENPKIQKPPNQAQPWCLIQ